jgi:hypothetical protein
LEAFYHLNNEGMVVDFLQDLLLTHLKLYTIVFVNHFFILHFHSKHATISKMPTQEHLTKTAFTNEVQDFITLYDLISCIIQIHYHFIAKASQSAKIFKA